MITRQDVEALNRTLARLDTYHGPLSIATGEFASVDEAVDLIRDKLMHFPDRPVLWAVDSRSDDEDRVTLCITGNGPRAEAHAEMIAALLEIGPGLVERCLWLEGVVNDLDQQSTELRVPGRGE